MRVDPLPHEFVEFIPNELEDGVLYVSITYATAVHLCASGCGERVVTPLTPTDWAVTFDGETVSLWPSVGNHAFACRSHYWIENDRVVWAPPMSDEEIAAVRRRGRQSKQRCYADGRQLEVEEAQKQAPGSWLQRVWRWLRRAT